MNYVSMCQVDYKFKNRRGTSGKETQNGLQVISGERRGKNDP